MHGITIILESSVVDPNRLCSDPDPGSHVHSDPDLDPDPGSHVHSDPDPDLAPGSKQDPNKFGSGSDLNLSIFIKSKL